MSSARRAAFVAVGSELLRTDRLDSNSLLVARLLRPCGFALVEKRCVEDDVAAVADAVRELCARAELVILSGGLGPTADDVTREGVARALGRGLEQRPELLGELEARYRAQGRTMPPVAARMATVVAGAELLRNQVGTAPGEVVASEGGTVVLLPGVPSELRQILEAHVVPRFAASHGVLVRTLRLAGVYESPVEQRVRHLYDRFGRERVTILGARGQVTLILTAAGPNAVAELEEMEAAFTHAAGPDLFGRDDESLAGVVIDRLRARGLTLATAESCTGGLIGSQLTAVPGASDVFVGGVIGYANELKQRLLGVTAGTLTGPGAVSRETAEAMARGACALGAACGLAVTGIAGPTGGSAEKPVGTVHIAAATPAGIAHARHRFPGDRTAVREFAASFALDLLRRQLEAVP
jgi:nicotinamide-nucleotide amidase